MAFAMEMADLKKIKAGAEGSPGDGAKAPLSKGDVAASASGRADDPPGSKDSPSTPLVSGRASKASSRASGASREKSIGNKETKGQNTLCYVLCTCGILLILALALIARQNGWFSTTPNVDPSVEAKGAQPANDASNGATVEQAGQTNLRGSGTEQPTPPKGQFLKVAAVTFNAAAAARGEANAPPVDEAWALKGTEDAHLVVIGYQHAVFSNQAKGSWKWEQTSEMRWVDDEGMHLHVHVKDSADFKFELPDLKCDALQQKEEGAGVWYLKDRRGQGCHIIQNANFEHEGDDGRTHMITEKDRGTSLIVVKVLPQAVGSKEFLLCLANTHMSRYTDAKRRWEKITEVLDAVKFVGCAQLIFIGDFNTRLNCVQDTTSSTAFWNKKAPDMIKSLCPQGGACSEEYKKYDELSLFMKGDPFACFERPLFSWDDPDPKKKEAVSSKLPLTEAPITFSPTYLVRAKPKQDEMKADEVYCPEAEGWCYVPHSVPYKKGETDIDVDDKPAFPDRILMGSFETTTGDEATTGIEARNYRRLAWAADGQKDSHHIAVAADVYITLKA